VKVNLIEFLLLRLKIKDTINNKNKLHKYIQSILLKNPLFYQIESRFKSLLIKKLTHQLIAIQLFSHIVKETMLGQKSNSRTQMKDNGKQIPHLTH
jgi:hypothetical protein